MIHHFHDNDVKNPATAIQLLDGSPLGTIPSDLNQSVEFQEFMAKGGKGGEVGSAGPCRNYRAYGGSVRSNLLARSNCSRLLCRFSIQFLACCEDLLKIMNEVAQSNIAINHIGYFALSVHSQAHCYGSCALSSSVGSMPMIEFLWNQSMLQHCPVNTPSPVIRPDTLHSHFSVADQVLGWNTSSHNRGTP